MPETELAGKKIDTVMGLCSRCSRTIPAKAAKCPYCGLKQSQGRHFPLFLGVCGLMALVFVIGLMIYSIRQSDIQANPDPENLRSAPAPARKPALGN
jgi:hypothetical protein